MYIPVDCETSLRLLTPEGIPSGSAVVSIAANREKTFIATVTHQSIYIWLSQPQLLLCILTLSEAETLEKGDLQKVYWRYDSSSIAVTTSLNHILIYRVDISEENCFNLSDPNDSMFRRTSQELFLRGSRPALSLYPSVDINLAANATCCVPLREELLVCVRNGFCHHISWDGTIHADYSIRLGAVPFAHDQLQSKPEFISDPSVHVVDAVYAPLIGGYCIVLSDGRAALLTSSDSRFHPNSLLGVWALHLRDACCADVNHKFRLLVFGCANGDVTAYHLDDANGSLTQTYRVALKVSNGPELINRVGRVNRVQVLSGGGAMAAVWSTDPMPMTSSTEGDSPSSSSLPPTLAIFTPFGSQTWCSLESMLTSTPAVSSGSYSTVEWGPEGYRLWLGRTDGLTTIAVARAAGAGNPVMEHSDRLVLMTCSRVLVSPPREREKNAVAPHAVWTTLHVPNEYIAANWPLKFASLDHESSRVLVVAGARGLAHCNLTTNRWKIFGNESQERDLVVTGGVFSWNGTAAAACYDADNGKEWLRFYPLSTKLDKRFASQTETEARVLLLSTRDDALVTFDVEARILLYKMRRTDDRSADSVATIVLERQAEIRVGDLITHPACLVSIQLTQLNIESGGSCFMPGVDTVLVNISGRLITLNPRNSTTTSNIDEDERFQLNQPIMVASFVESVWHDRARSGENDDATNGNDVIIENGSINNRSGREETRSHLAHALWINCGAKGMRVWLPLFPSRRSLPSQDTSFISKRIMLPFDLSISPLVVCASSCLAVGVESLPVQLLTASKETTTVYNLSRNSEVFVHHILRQLLKRNLGVFALEMAAGCRKLEHFPHSLELLLHGVLEEEATSSEPIPDPLLPRCVAFIQEFPEFLRTIAHCARKTELALWPSLFAVTGSPNDLFEVCLRDNQLQTAASFLIVLQSIENAQTSQEQAVRLLSEALSSGCWTIARDMLRFARAIDADDMHSPARTPPPQQKTSGRRPAGSVSLNANEANELVFSRFQAAGRMGKVRHSHEHRESSRKDSTGSSRKVGRALSNDTSPPSPPPLSSTNPMVQNMERMMEEHAGRLLDQYCIRDLGFFCSELRVSLGPLLSRRPVDDFSLALTRLHSQFSWPYPVPGKHVVDQLEKRFGQMRMSRSSASLNGHSQLESPRSTIAPPTSDRLATIADSDCVVTSSSETTGDSSISVQEARLVPLNQVASDSPSNSNGIRPPSPSSSIAQTAGTPDTRSGNGVADNDWQGVEVLVGEASGRGSSICQAQLQHMLGLFAEAAAIDWVFLVCLISRDISSLRRLISPPSIPNWGVANLGQTRLGCLSLIEWASHNCLGYIPILHLFSTHLDLVAEQAGCLNLPPKRDPIAITKLANGETNKTLQLSEVPRRGQQADALRDAFRPRERSRSVDRGRDQVTVAQDEGEGCVVM